jgi:hypothetical protein
MLAGMHTPSPRSRVRVRAVAVPAGSMRAVNTLLAVAATLCLLAAAAASIAR